MAKCNCGCGKEVYRPNAGLASTPKAEAKRRRKISKARRGMVFSAAHRRKLAKAKLGTKRSKVTRQRMSVSRKEHFAQRTKGQCKMCCSLNHTTESHQKKIKASIQKHRRWGSRWFTKHKHSGITMRSSWEVAFADKLDKWKMEWKYEPKGFKLGNQRLYYPDFYLPEYDLYIEIKGYLFKRDRLKLKRFRKRYPDIRWMMLQKEELEMLGVFTKDKSTRKQAKAFKALFITD